jgi:N,N'-diacetylchitobiose transport system substrate-binding protein
MKKTLGLAVATTTAALVLTACGGGATGSTTDPSAGASGTAGYAG